VTDARRLSQAISEGDGISVIVQVDDLEQARAAAEQGAEGLALRAPIEGLADAVALPVLWVGEADAHAAQSSCNAHAVIVWVDDDRLHALRARFGEETELVVGVVDEEDLESALALDAHVFLLSVQEDDDDQDEIDRVIELLPDVPAGKLAIAEVEVVSRDEVLALERAGFDAVLVPPGHVGELVGGAPPEV
jgi:formate-dependent phosphoribosylglycinamide formyltransferase (GAR transformylase)